MPISPTVPTSEPAAAPDQNLAYFAGQAQAAFDEVADFVNDLETAIVNKAAKDAANVFDAASSAALVSLQPAGAGDALDVTDSGTKTFSLDKSGVMMVGDQQMGSTFGDGAQVSFIGGVAAFVKHVLAAFGNDASSYVLNFYKSRATAVDGRDSVVLGDSLGRMSFGGDAGASEEEGAYILCTVAGVIGEAGVISTISRTSNVVTITTTAAHGIVAGNAISVEGVSKPSFNGFFTVTAATSTTLTYSQTATNDSDTTGIVARRNLPSAISFGTRDVDEAAASERCRVRANGDFVVTGPGALGYGTGAGGTFDQLTSKATGVTLNKSCGQIVLNAANLAAGAIVSFTLTNAMINSTDILALNHITTGTFGAYTLNARAAAGSAIIDVRNNSGAGLAEAIVIRFVLIRSVIT